MADDHAALAEYGLSPGADFDPCGAEFAAAGDAVAFNRAIHVDADRLGEIQGALGWVVLSRGRSGLCRCYGSRQAGG